MIKTETKLWTVIRTAVNQLQQPGRFDRIESPITPGASDVHYVVPDWSGWIELKTAKWPVNGRPLRLQHPFSLAQFGWLLDHHNTANRLVSWLVVGVAGPSSWRGFLLADAPASAALIENRPPQPLGNLLELHRVFWANTPKDLLEFIHRPYLKEKGR